MRTRGHWRWNAQTFAGPPAWIRGGDDTISMARGRTARVYRFDQWNGAATVEDSSGDLAAASKQ